MKHAPRHARARLLVPVCGALALAGGCALTSKSDPVLFRYFTPEGLDRAEPTATATADTAKDLQIRFGRVTSAAYLKDRIAFRDSSFEIGYLDDARWTEKPETYLRRALSRALFEKHGIQQIISGPGPMLEVELEAFEEMRAPRHAARVELTWSVSDDQVVRAQERFTVERELSAKGSSSPSEIAKALSVALDEAVSRVVARVTSLLPTIQTAREVPMPVDAGVDARAAR